MAKRPAWPRDSDASRCIPWARAFEGLFIEWIYRSLSVRSSPLFCEVGHVWTVLHHHNPMMPAFLAQGRCPCMYVCSRVAHCLCTRPGIMVLPAIKRPEEEILPRRGAKAIFWKPDGYSFGRNCRSHRLLQTSRRIRDTYDCRTVYSVLTHGDLRGPTTEFPG